MRMRQRDRAKRQTHGCLRDCHLLHDRALPKLRGLLWQTDRWERPALSLPKRLAHVRQHIRCLHIAHHHQHIIGVYMRW